VLEPYHFRFASFGFFRKERVIRSSIVPIMLCLDVIFLKKNDPSTSFSFFKKSNIYVHEHDDRELIY
jgi:hypothetical protein